MENPFGAVAGNTQNSPTANVPRTFSTFPLKYHLFDTHRFGEYHPHYVEDGVKNDKLPIRSSHNVMSYTLKSPLMQNITMYKDYFSVPMEAILPLNWEKFFDNPVRGDDVNNDVGPSVENFWAKCSTMFGAVYTQLLSLAANNSTTDAALLLAIFRTMILGEMLYSNGSLMSSLGCHGSPYFSASETIGGTSFKRDFDNWFDTIIDSLKFKNDAAYTTGVRSFKLTVDGYTYNVNELLDVGEQYGNVITWNHALSLMRDNAFFTISDVVCQGISKVKDAFPYSNWTLAAESANVPNNLSRLWAYQISCAHYYSNDHIDFIYSADLYRQLIGSYIKVALGSSYSNRAYFTRNGITYLYDYCSAHFVSYMFDWIKNNPSYILSNTADGSQTANALGYMSAIFSYRRSLRYLDYFTGSRAQPLAVGSTGVTVSGSTVDVVDITRNIQRQRFLNAVNRVRHNLEGYLQGIFGGDVPAPDYHNPFFLASTQDDIYGQQTENTGASQMTSDIAITSNLRSNGSRYMLEIHCDRPCIIIGITHYDLARAYTRSIERSFLHVDRFDMFNPFMQFIGDQPVYAQELGIDGSGTQLLSMNNFAYQLRHSEYKQRYNQAAGAFVTHLPGFVFLANVDRGNQMTINPDWIRSVPSEIDKFYVSLTGRSLGSYFHFIVDNFNDCSGERPMAYAPSIL